MVPFSDEPDGLCAYAGATVLCGEKTLSFKNWRISAGIVHRDGYEGGAGLADMDLDRAALIVFPTCVHRVFQ